jgi:hypothetical protein
MIGVHTCIVTIFIVTLALHLQSVFQAWGDHFVPLSNLIRILFSPLHGESGESSCRVTKKVVAELCMRWRRWPQIVKDFKGSEVEAVAASEGSGERRWRKF